jgi:uncharacterized Zn finger protein
MAKGEKLRSEMAWLECNHCHEVMWHNWARKGYSGAGGWRCTKCGELTPEEVKHVKTAAPVRLVPRSKRDQT